MVVLGNVRHVRFLIVNSGIATLKVDMIQTIKHTCLVDVDLNKSEYLFNKRSDLIKDVCLLTGIIFLEWAQYIDYWIGYICFQNEQIKVICEEFPNNLSFEPDSINRTELLLEKLV
ncbi:hypothetical protein [Psychrobacter sp. GP33]|uniref:hypothetical protein n=1 Tax=Psychrobacter sp. GP33 TaxID=2758709 RepID=UPI0015FCABE3|nr:hypothetical protein [Psychrobacter sp. GP33]